MDWVALGAFAPGLAALLAVFVTKRTRTATHAFSEVVDGDVLGQFRELFDRIGNLELDLAETKADLKLALKELRELRKLEEYLQAKLHEKDTEVRALRADKASLREALKSAESRIAYLERACKRAGIGEAV